MKMKKEFIILFLMILALTVYIVWRDITLKKEWDQFNFADYILGK